MTAIEQFYTELDACLEHAHANRVPLENIVLALDEKHFTELAIMQRVRAIEDHKRQAGEIVIAHGIPNGHARVNGG